jgi:hypothetical protein
MKSIFPNSKFFCCLIKSQLVAQLLSLLLKVKTLWHKMTIFIVRKTFSINISEKFSLQLRINILVEILISFFFSQKARIVCRKDFRMKFLHGAKKA